MKAAKPDRGWVVELTNRITGKWFMLSYTFEYDRRDAIAKYLASGVVVGCPACWWREQQRNGKARCVRVVLKEDGQ